MHFALVYYPDVGTELIDKIRRKYDPTALVVKPHLTILFPVPASIGVEPLQEHIGRILRQWRPFPIRLHGFKTSPDHWLFLTLAEGNSDVVRLFEELHTGLLAKYLRHDIEFIPHIGLGLFLKKGVRYDMTGNPNPEHFDTISYHQALQDAETLHLDFRCTVRALHLVEIPEEFFAWACGKRADLPGDRRVVTRIEFSLQTAGA